MVRTAVLMWIVLPIASVDSGDKWKECRRGDIASGSAVRNSVENIRKICAIPKIYGLPVTLL
jgi:hypothetical protein